MQGWREAFDRAREASIEWLHEEQAQGLRPVPEPKRWNVGFTATPDVAERINQFIREQAAGLVVRYYDLDEDGRPCR